MGNGRFFVPGDQTSDELLGVLATWKSIRWLLLFIGISYFVVIVFSSSAITPGALILMGLSVAPLYILVGVYKSARKHFFQTFAELNGWEYAETGDAEKEAGAIFRKNSGGRITNQISGRIDERVFRIFSFSFATVFNENKKTIFYTVFAFKFAGSFPNFYLNRKGDQYGFSVGERVPLPLAFEEKFSLSAPREYEIEALEIFTPDVLAALLDGEFPYDIEFANQEVLIFSEGQITDSGMLWREFKRVLKIEDLFDEKLDRFKFQPIGDLSPVLH